MGGLSNKHENSPSRRNHLTKQNGDVTDTNRNQLSAGRCRAESCLVCALNHPFWQVMSTSVKTWNPPNFPTWLVILKRWTPPILGIPLTQPIFSLVPENREYLQLWPLNIGKLWLTIKFWGYPIFTQTKIHNCMSTLDDKTIHKFHWLSFAPLVWCT